VRAGELPHIPVYDIQAQGKHDGDQGELHRDDPVVAHPGPQVQDGIEKHYVDCNRKGYGGMVEHG